MPAELQRAGLCGVGEHRAHHRRNEAGRDRFAVVFRLAGTARLRETRDRSTSLGSCYAFLASSHDLRLRVNVFNHCSTYFADVVWTGLSTQHIRSGIESDIDLERLREAWMAISPMHYMDRVRELAEEVGIHLRDVRHDVSAVSFEADRG